MILLLVTLLVMVLIFLVLEFLISLLYKRYKGYARIDQCLTAWSWVHSSWNYIGARDFRGPDRTPVRHLGVRWFGHEWEQQIEIPMGELRF
jgi:hypothetical protein